HHRGRTLWWKMSPEGDVTKSLTAAPAAAAVRQVDITSNGHPIGHVAVFLPLDSSLVRWLTAAANPHLGAQEQLGIAQGRMLVGTHQTVPIQSGEIQSGTPNSSGTDVRAGGIGYRALVEGLSGTAATERLKLVALERSSHIDAKANGARWRLIA